MPSDIQEASNIVRGALEALNSGDTESFLGHFSDDMQFWMNGDHQFSGLLEGKAAFIELLGRVMVGIDGGIALEVDNILSAGDWAVTESNGTAKTSSGEPYNNRYCMLWRVKDGKIIVFKEYNDSAMVVANFPQ